MKEQIQSPDTKSPSATETSFTHFHLYLFLLGLSILSLIILLVWAAFINTGQHSGRARILYLTWDESQHNQLYLIDPAGGTSQALTSTPFGIFDFAVSPDGQEIVFSALREDGGSDIYILDPNQPDILRSILSCAGDLCTGAAWHPAGNLLVYERRPLDKPNAPPGSPRLWWLDPSNGETVPIFDDTEWLGLNAAFSADGTWLSYTAPQFQEIHAYNRQTGQTVVISSQTGEPAVWHPTETIMLTSEIQPQGEAFSTHIFRVEIPSAFVINLSNELAVNDGSPTFKPDGSQILFARKVARAPMGRQLWLMQPDGTDPVRLTAEFDYNHGLPSWSPDGTQILLQRFNITLPDADPGIWIYDLPTGNLTEVVSPGIQPAWLP